MSSQFKRQDVADDGKVLDRETSSDPKQNETNDDVIFVEHLKPKRAYYYALTERPCAVLHISSMDAFIVGTYELVDLDGAKKAFPNMNDDELVEKLEAINYRLGSLYLYVNTYSVFGYREFHKLNCVSGGVFDIVESFEVPGIRHAKRFYVAHANGTIGQYDVRIDEIVSVGTPVRIVEDSTVLLTSIDCLNDPIGPNGSLIVVGESAGNISIPFDQPKSSPACPVRTRVCDDPVWQVKLLRSGVSELHSTKERYVLVGAENSKWYIYKFDLERLDFTQLYKNDDFQAGVTSFCFRSSNTDLFQVSPHARFFVGSYDETIREYVLSLEPNFGESDHKISVTSAGFIKVPGAGIWRMDYIQAKNETYDSLNIASMYTNPCTVLIPAKNDGSSLQPNSIDSGELHQISYKLKSELNDKPLHYGFVQSRSEKNYCILDFNNRLCIFTEMATEYPYDSMRRIYYLCGELKSFSMKRWLSGSNSDDNKFAS